jgi:osmotically-inducible protein OsmY
MTMSMEDSELRRKVIAELEWEPTVDASAIGVLVRNGAVTLTGAVHSYFEKRSAEAAIKRVGGVRAVADELAVELPDAIERTDSDISQAALAALRFNVAVPAERLRVVVEGGWVTLEGEVDWLYQKAAAESAVRCLYGVKGVTDRIEVRPHVAEPDIKAQIEAAFARRAKLEASRIRVEREGDAVTLRGVVQTFAEKDEAEYAAWSTRGVAKVHNDIVVSP